MDEATRERIERACEKLVIRYTHLTDMEGGKGVADLFTDDGVLDLGAVKLEGREQLLAANRARDPERLMVHVCTNIATEVVDDTHATGVTYLTAYVEQTKDGVAPPLGEPAMVGRYHDEFVRTLDGWKFASRRVVTMLRREQ